MTRLFTKYIVVGGASFAMLSLIVSSDAKVSQYDHFLASTNSNQTLVADTPKTPATLPYQFKDQSAQDPLNYPNSGGFRLKNPSNVSTGVEYNPVTKNYEITQKMGDINYRPPTYMESEEYQNMIFKKQVKNYWNQRVDAETKSSQNNAVIPKLNVGGVVFDRIFGGNTVDIRPNGSAELIFAFNGNKNENPSLPVRNQRTRMFDFDEKIQLNVVGKIGDKLKLTTSYNTEATFDFENQMKLEYTGYEDEIIKKIEAGNVSLPLSGSLITGSQTLFGVKTQLQFGRLTVTSVLTQQKGKKSEVEVTGGAQVSKFEVAGDAYEANKHFFLGHYFRDNFNKSLEKLPFVNSPVNINRIEVWISNVNNSVNDVRNVIGFSELGEDVLHIPSDQQTFVKDISSNDLPYNDQNELYQRIADSSVIGMREKNTAVSTLDFLSSNALKQTINFELINARKLQPSEYTFNPRLGFISLNQQLNADQVLCVAYQYTIDGKVYQVGEFSDGGVAAPQNLFVKMLKSTVVNTKKPMWDLMMKNIYSIGAYQVNTQDFKLDVFYTNPATGSEINYLPVTSCQGKIHAKPLIQVLSLDKLNQQNDAIADGVFDFIDGVTINANNGRIIFPVTEPFGEYLYSQFDPACSALEANKYAFSQLYDSTLVLARMFPNLNRFKLKGSYQSSGGSEISLGATNVPQGSVVVTAGGIALQENVQYTVDYTLGRVKIIDAGVLNSGTPIKVSLESNALFAIQQKTLFGTHLDYRVNKDFNLGGTILRLTERPLTQKVNIGDEPISNVIWGLDGNYRTEAPFLTRLVDKIPLIETKETSTITASGEFAQLVPGHSKAIGKNGNSYIDDFEGSQSEIDLRQQSTWSLASTPQGQPSLFPEGAFADSLAYGYNRAKLSWYVIDPLMLRTTTGLTPDNIDKDDMSNHFTREITETEVFPNRPSTTSQPTIISTLDLAYYPSERGPYNYDVTPTNVSKGLDANGNLNNPTTRWGGIMRALQTTDFETANVEFIQFWVMDPFNADNENPHTTGDLYFNIGNISEDVLRDSYRSAENGLPAPSTAGQNNGNNLPTDTTAWGIVPSVQPLVNAFNNDEGDRASQDVGLDGLSNAQEKTFFGNYLSAVSALSPTAYNKILKDPSADDFHYFRGSDYDAAGLKTLERYKEWNGTEGNSKTTAQSPESYPTQGPTSGNPNVEDINRDNNLSTTESYYQYHVGLKPSDFAGGVGTNYITNVYSTTGQNIKNGDSKPITWYQFKIPIRDPNVLKVGDIENFQSIRFFRMFIKGADKPIVLRFARLELVRNDWRKYGFDLLDPSLYEGDDVARSQFDIGAVNIEEDGNKQPVNYVLPPQINREINAGTANLIQLNEQAMSLTVCNLEDGNARAAFKNANLDVRSYKKLRMFIHAEASANKALPLNNDDLSVFVRLGTDYTDNYYEYEIPLKVTAPGSYNGSDESSQYIVWPEANEMILEFSKLLAAKQKRNNDMFNGIVSLTGEYAVKDGTRKIIVKGNPTLSAIRTLMIGVRNPKQGSGIDNDDGQPKCAQIWVNELRLTDFDEEGGWAANARVTAKLADFGSVSLSGNMYTPGFGSIENKVSERKRETLKQYDISSSLELGKFLPEDLGIHVPMYVGYSQSIITPQFDPLDPDILLAPKLKDNQIPATYRDSLAQKTQDYTQRKSINFTNVKKDKGKNSKKSHIYDVENLSASYSYNESFKRNINIEYLTQRNYRGVVTYAYSPAPKNIKPFEKAKLFQSKYLLLIKDINFYLLPNKIGFSTDVDRSFSTQKNRAVDNMLSIPATFNKRFGTTRNYDFKYDITKGLKLDYTATNTDRILEPYGEIDTKEKKDTVRNNLLKGGSTTQFTQQIGVNYAIPINKIPLLDFTSLSFRYGGMYGWDRAPFNADSLGHTIKNSRTQNWNGQLNMVTLYNKVPYLKKINQKQRGKGGRAPASAPVKGKVPTDIKGKEKDGKAASDSTKKEKQDIKALEYIARFLTGIKTVSGTYAITEGMVLPGYAQSTRMFGMDNNFAGPTVGFILGAQDDSMRFKSAERGWLVKTQSMNRAYTKAYSENLNVKANIEPLPDLKIEVNATKTSTKNFSEFYRWKRDTLSTDPTQGKFDSESPLTTGNFSMSYLTFSTSFKDGEAVFKDFLDARTTISARLGEKNKNSDYAIGDYQEGYNETSQDVLIPAFLAAYSGKSANSIVLKEIQNMPKPNWRITYDGLSKLEKIKKYFKSFTLSHAYRSSYNIGNYTTNLLWTDHDRDGYTDVLEKVSSVKGNPNFLPERLIGSVTISEQWSPLIKLDMTLHNSILVSFEFKKDRNISLALTNKNITEVAGREVVSGIGYRIANLKLGDLKIKGKPIKSDLNLKLDLSLRKNETVMRQIVEGVSTPTAGTNIISIKISADYVISEKVNVRLFYDRIATKPVLSNTFPNTNTNAGLSLRLQL